MAEYLELLPAVDVRGGQAVQLVRGAVGTAKVLGDPITAALNWQTRGAEWIHLVDVDAAYGQGNNRSLLAEIIGRLDVAVELSGGIRDDESLTAAMATGCRRVVISTDALDRREWCSKAIAEFGDRVAVGLDVSGTTLSARGSDREGGDLYDVLGRLDSAGCGRNHQTVRPSSPPGVTRCWRRGRDHRRCALRASVHPGRSAVSDAAARSHLIASLVGPGGHSGTSA